LPGTGIEIKRASNIEINRMKDFLIRILNENQVLSQFILQVDLNRFIGELKSY